MRKIASALFALSLLTYPALAASPTGEPIKIGDINIGTKALEYSVPYKNGIELAVSEINAEGGVLGRPLDVISRDSKMDPGEAVRLADELKSRDKVSALIVGEGSNVTLATSIWSKRNKVPLLDAFGNADTIVHDYGHDYIFRAVFGGYAEASATLKRALEIYGDKLKNKRWVVVAPNYEYGHSVANAFKTVAESLNLNAEWVGEQWPAFGKLEAGPTVAALHAAKPDIIVNLVVASDLPKLVREGNKRGLFKNKIVIAPETAVPEHYTTLGKEMPVGWVSLGFPSEEIRDKGYLKFRNAYQDRFHLEPTIYALYSYVSIQALASAISHAGTTEPTAIRDALATYPFPTPFGESRFRTIDRQAELPIWIGESGLKNGKPALLNWHQENETDHSPPDSWILEQRAKANAAN